jgi:putative ABC transport system permease protein
VSARRVRRIASGRGMSRRVQTVVIFLVLMASTAAATVGLTLLAVDSNGPFQRSFATQNGADVTAGIYASRATSGQLAATGRLPGVTRAAGPFPVASIGLDQDGYPLATVTAAGRAASGGPVDDLTLTSGRWAQRPGEIVIANDLGQGPGRHQTFQIGSEVTVTTAPGHPTLTVVGTAQSITDTAGAWVVPGEIAALRPAGAPGIEQMLYRFTAAASAPQIRADIASVTAALPTGAVAGTASWLTAESRATGTSAIYSPFVMAFAIMGLAMSVLIVANVVSGAVVAGYRQIGVLKSIGLTPAQVVTAYVARVGQPALAGCLIGVGAGDALAIPVLAQSATVYSVGRQMVPLWVDVVTPLGMFAVAVLAALLPALRAGRLSAVQAIATGQAPRQGRGHAAYRLLGRLRLPRPVSIGLAAPFARPGRAAVTCAAILFGTTAVIFAVGLDSSLAKAAAGVAVTNGPGQVLVETTGNNPAFTRGEEQKAVAAIRAQPGTAHYVAEATPTIGVDGLTKQVSAEAFQTDARWIGYEMVTGHWYDGQGQADVNTTFLTQTGLSVGDTTTVSSDGKVITARIVGEVFDPDNQPVLIAGWQTLGGVAAGLSVTQYDIDLRPGISLDSYANSLNRALGPALGTGTDRGGQFFSVARSLISILTLMIAVVAGLGVLNTVLLGARERVHDLGVLRALGMTPPQTLGMVVCWVAGPAVAAAIIAVPAATALHSATVRAMASAAHTGIPGDVVHMLGSAQLAALASSGLVIAAAGALLPGTWAARSRTAAAIRAE